MGIYNLVDVYVSPSGDLKTQSNGDLSVAMASGVLQQDIAFRLRTNPGEFIPHLDLGAGLDEIVGEPNSRETSIIGEKKIINSLTGDGMVSLIDLTVRGVPIALDRLVYYVFVNSMGGQINVTPSVTFNLNSGFQNI